MLYTLCGLSGSGKTTLLEALLQQMPHLARLVTFTTRPPRPGEVPGREYHFITEADFHTAVATRQLVCPIQYRGFWYATAPDNLSACTQTDTLAVLRPDKISCLAFYTPITAIYVEMVGHETPANAEECLIFEQKQTCHHTVLNSPGHVDQAVTDLLSILMSAP